MVGRDLISAAFLGAVATLSVVQPSSAKHRVKLQSGDGDPCAAPHAYVREHIDRIKALQASAPQGNGNLFDMLQGQKDFDTKRSAEISELRYEADGVNALLVAGGCKAFDLDQELSPRAK